MNSDKKEKDLIVQQFTSREEGLEHPTYDLELEFYQMVSSGNIEFLDKKDDYGEVDKKESGTLSTNPIRNLKYHIIVTIAMVARHCIENGMPESESYSLSDYYIREVDETNSEKKLRAIHKDLIYDYAIRMRNLKQKSISSIHCIKAMDYIQNHLHENIKLVDIAEYVGLESTYFSRHFHQCMNMKVTYYILYQKLDAAMNMLKYSDYSCSEIAEYLSFPSSSSMGASFKKLTGMTPLEYRQKNYRKHWNIQ